MVKAYLRYMAERQEVARGATKPPEPMPIHLAFAVWALGAKIALVLLIGMVVWFTLS